MMGWCLMAIQAMHWESWWGYALESVTWILSIKLYNTIKMVKVIIVKAKLSLYFTKYRVMKMHWDSWKNELWRWEKWVEQIQDRVQWRSLLLAVLNFLVILPDSNYSCNSFSIRNRQSNWHWTYQVPYNKHLQTHIYTVSVYEER
jgi:hypothetical protein